MSDADKYWGRTLTNIALIIAAAWGFSTAAWYTIEIRKLLWEERIPSACTWSPDAPSLDARPVEPCEPLKPDGLWTPKQKFLPEPELLPLVEPVRSVRGAFAVRQ